MDSIVPLCELLETTGLTEEEAWDRTGLYVKSLFDSIRTVRLNPMGEEKGGLASIYPVITVFYRVITRFLTFCSETTVIGPFDGIITLKYRYRRLPPAAGTYRVY